MKYFLVLLVFAFSYAKSEETMIHGNVYGLDANGERVGLPGVRVQWLDSQKGGLSNSNGHFMFYTDGDIRHLVFYMPGYQTDTLFLEDIHKFIHYDMKPIQTEQAIVEGQQPAKIYESSLEAKETITRKQLSHLACCNLSEAFESDPNVSLQYTDPVSGAKRIKLMGLDGKYSQVMIEKLPFVRGLNIPYGLSFLPGPWIESISISKGTADVTNGFENFTGQINVELKKSDKENSLANSFFDAGQRVEINASENFSLSENLSSILLMHGSLIPQFIDMNNDNFTDRPVTKSFNIMNKYQYNDAFRGVAGQVGFRAIYDNRQSKLTNITPYEFNIDNSRFEVFFKNGYDLNTSNLGFLGSVSYQNNQTNNDFFSYSNKFNLSHYNANLSVNHIYGFDQSPVSSEYKFTYGASFLYDNFINELSSTTFNSNPNLEYITPGAYANLNVSSIENLDFSVGIRADYNELNNVFFTPRALLRYKPSDYIDIRINAGKGYRYNNAFAENIYLFFYDLEDSYVNQLMSFSQNKMEEAWNYGINANFSFNVFEKLITINAEYYKTDFMNRVIVDQYRYTEEYRPQIYESDKTSYSESMGIDLDIPFGDKIEFSTSVRYDNSFFTNINNDLVREPLSSVFKSLTNIYWTLPWDLSLRTSANYHGWGKRTLTNSDGSFKNFDPFWLFSAQLNTKFESLNLEVYLGSENISSYSILENNADLQTIGANYIGTDLWGPLMGRNFYIGINWTGF